MALISPLVLHDIRQNIIGAASHDNAGAFRCKITDDIFLRIEDLIL